VYCVFLETGNNGFFIRVVSVFCENVVRSIIDLYEKNKDELFTEKSGCLPTMENIDKVLKNRGSVLYFLNCGQFLDVRCINDGCYNGHMTALAPDQVEDIEIVMKNYRDNFISQANGLRPIDRLRIERVFNRYNTANIQQIKLLDFLNARTLNGNDHTQYLQSYIQESNKMMYEASDFIYVRAQNSIDYNYFIANTVLPNILPCDTLQHI